MEPFARIDLPGADVRYAAHAIDPVAADRHLDALLTEIDWQQHHLKIFGRTVAAPRLSCWVGDADAAYTYSRTRFEPAPWTPALAELRDWLEVALAVRFNSVLANLYRDGRDAMGWHSDDETELGPEQLIASLSFGAPRAFRLRSRSVPRVTHTIDLAHGSLLVMAGATQARYEHALPRRAGVHAPRINLTFRLIDAGRVRAGTASRGRGR